MVTVGLNLDVLAIVCRFLTRISDVLSFSLTCSALRPIAIQQLLSIHTIPLTSTLSIRRFHRFLFADEHARAPHVRWLKVGNQTLRPQIGNQPGDESLLLDILKSCTHLEHFSLSAESTTYQHSNDWIFNKATANWIGEPMDMYLLLQAIRAPLRVLSVDVLNPKGDKWDPATLEEFLPRFAPTLEKLELRNLSLVGSGESDGRATSTMTQYHGVRSLTIRFLDGIPLVDLLQHLFPALDGTLRIHESVGTDFAGANKHIRMANQRTQDRRPDNPWKKLDRLVCGPMMFYLLGLRCPIGLVMIDQCSEYSKGDLVAALRNSPIRRLKLSLMLTPGYGIFDGLFPAELGRTLSHLTLCLVDTKGGAGTQMPDVPNTAVTELGWSDILDKMTSSLAPLQKLTHLRVVVHYNVYDNPSQPRARSKFGDALHHSKIVLEAVAASIVRLLPSLQYLFIATSAWFGNFDVTGRWRVARAWRVVPAGEASGQTEGGQPVLVGLTPKVAEAIIRKEELVLSEADEVALHISQD